MSDTSRRHAVSRRAFLASLGALAGTAWLTACSEAAPRPDAGSVPTPAPPTSPPPTPLPPSADVVDCTEGLASFARSAGILYGASIAHEAFEDPPLLDLYRSQVGVLTTDVAFKFDWLRPEGPDEWEWYFVDEIMAFAADVAVPVRPHVLVWNENLPEWVRDLSVAERTRVFDEHIETVMTRSYGAEIHSWDVVNEPFWPGHGEVGGWRTGPWYEAMGPGYVERAFRRAAAADPRARLVLNEAHTERSDELGRTIRGALLDLTRSLSDAGVPLHAVGLQSHLFADPSVPTEVYDFESFAGFVRNVADLGVDIYITELDVDDELLVRDGIGEKNRDRWVADRYRRFLEAVLPIPAVKVVVTWQLSDRTSWLREFEPAVRPLPFDDRGRPKAACEALAGAFREAPDRPS